mgnify:CR=1 FL=1
MCICSAVYRWDDMNGPACVLLGLTLVPVGIGLIYIIIFNLFKPAVNSLIVHRYMYAGYFMYDVRICVFGSLFVKEWQTLQVCKTRSEADYWLKHYEDQQK